MPATKEDIRQLNRALKELAEALRKHKHIGTDFTQVLNFFRSRASHIIDLSHETNVVIGPGIATTATKGFLCIPSCAGAPTGTPTARELDNTIPLVFDRTNNRLYAYDGGWISVALA